MAMKIKYLILITFCLSIFACSENDEFLEDSAIITYSSPSVDGCGYFIMINSIDYKPINPEVIPDSYKQLINEVVELKYKLPGKFEYPCSSLGLIEGDGIEVIEIK